MKFPTAITAVKGNFSNVSIFSSPAPFPFFGTGLLLCLRKSFSYPDNPFLMEDFDIPEGFLFVAFFITVVLLASFVFFYELSKLDACEKRIDCAISSI